MTAKDLSIPDSPPEDRRVPVQAATYALAHHVQPQAAPGESGYSIDLRQYLAVLRKRWRTVVFATGVAVTIALIVTLLMKPIYQATATLQIDRSGMHIVNVDGMQADNGGADRDFYGTQYELIKSRALAERVVDQLGLSTDASFFPEASPTLFSSLFGMFRSEQPADIQSAAVPRRGAAVGMIQGGLLVAPVKGSTLVAISFSHPSPTIAQRVANGVAEAYISDSLDRRFNASAYARTFLEERLAQLKSRMEEAETQLVAYAREQGIVTTGKDTSLDDSNLLAMNGELMKLRAQRIRAQEDWELAKVTDGFNLPQVADSLAFQSNRSQYMDLMAQYQQKLQIYKPAFPEMVQLKARMTELDAAARRIADSVKDTVRLRYENTLNAEAALTAQLDAIKGEALASRDRSIQYNFLRREVDTNRTLYEGLLQRYKEIGVAGGVGTNNISFVDRAQKPGGPISPRLSINLAIGLLFGVALGTLGVIAQEYLDDTFKSPEDVESALHVPVIGLIPKPEDGQDPMEALADPWSPVSEAYRTLRTSLQFSTTDGTPRELVITSSRPSEGKSTTALALARNFAQIGQKVLIIDADLRNSSLHKKLGVDNEKGLSSYLAGHHNPQDVVRKGDIENLWYMTSGVLPPNPAELLAGPRMLSLLSLSAEQFDLVIVDAPPVMGLSDTPLLASVAQATLLVIAAGECRRDAARVTMKNLRYARVHLVGALLTKFDAQNVGYGYGYGYGYGDSYHRYGSEAHRLPRTEPESAIEDRSSDRQEQV